MRRAQILRLIPHDSAMCLLDEVVCWDETALYCRSTLPPIAEHPLAREGRLVTVALIEYAAQAAGLHGALRARRRGEPAPAGGVLAGVQDVALEGDRVPDRGGVLAIRAERQIGGTQGAIYTFDVRVTAAIGARGRLAVVLSDTGGHATGR